MLSLNRIPIKLLIILISTLPFYSIAQNTRVFITVKPTDCISCMIPITDIIKEVAQLEPKVPINVLIRDIPSRMLSNYAKEVLHLSDTIPIISSDSLFNIFSIYNTSSVTIIDYSSKPVQRVSLPLMQWHQSKTTLISKWLTNHTIPKNLHPSSLGQAMGSIKMMVMANDSTVFINDQLMGSVHIFSTLNGELLETFAIDSTWYTMPFKNNSQNVKQIWDNQHVLQYISYPKCQFKGVFKQGNNIAISATCYYPFKMGNDFVINPKAMLYTLDSTFKPSFCSWLHVENPEPVLNHTRALWADDTKLITTSFNIVDKRIEYSDALFQYFKRVGDSLVFDYHDQPNYPHFLKSAASTNGIPFNQFSDYQGNKILWYSYYPEFYDMDTEKWIHIDTTHIPNDLFSFKIREDSESYNFEVLGVWKENYDYIMFLRFANEMFFIVQQEHCIKQSKKLLTLKDSERAYLARKNNGDFVVLIQNKTTGDAQFILIATNEDILWY